jgi:putative addiction module component (TIGR02574 family)
MTAEPSEVIRAGMSLSPADREAVALTLLESLDETVDQTTVDAAWGAEIKRRVDEIRGGKATMLSRDEVDAMIEGALAESDL